MRQFDWYSRGKNLRNHEMKENKRLNRQENSLIAIPKQLRNTRFIILLCLLCQNIQYKSHK